MLSNKFEQWEKDLKTYEDKVNKYKKMKLWVTDEWKQKRKVGERKA